MSSHKKTSANRLAITRRGFLGAAAVAGAGSALPGISSRAGAAPSSFSDAVDTLFSTLDQPGQPGAAVGIYHRGKVLHVRGYGHADLEHGLRVTPQTVFHVASVSKHFTAFAIALLASEGKLDLDADIRRYLPYVPDFGHVITVRQLVHHTSGLRDQWSLFGLAGQEIRNVLRQQQVVNLVKRQMRLNFEPGAEYSYSNTGYTLLAEIVAKVSGRSFRQFTTERIFAPLGMSSSFFYDDVSQVVPRRAHSYERKDATHPWRRALLNYETVGATSLHTTADDLLKWAGNFAQPKVGDAALIEQVQTSGTLRDGRSIAYGFGLDCATLAGHEAVLHTGWDAGFRAFFAYLPQHQFGVVLLRNSMDAAQNNMAAEDLFAPARALVDIYLNGGSAGSAANGSELARARPKPEQLSSLAGTYLHEFDRHLTLEHASGEMTMRRGTTNARVVFRTDGTFDLGNRQSGYYRPQTEGGRVVGFERLTDEAGARPAMAYRRFEKIAPAAADLAALAGEYRSAELDITYRLDVANGGLQAHSLWTAPPAALMPVVADRFEAASDSLQIVVFERDAQRRPTGFRAHTGRARNVWFERLR